jgi:elongation factor P--beta-lysine ligase
VTTEAQAQSKRQRARELQRQRRAKKRRIDYYPCEAAAAVIEALADAAGYSSVIDRLILRHAPDARRVRARNASTEGLAPLQALGD